MEQKKDLQRKNEEEERAILDDSSVSGDKDAKYDMGNPALPEEGEEFKKDLNRIFSKAPETDANTIGDKDLGEKVKKDEEEEKDWRGRKNMVGDEKEDVGWRKKVGEEYQRSQIEGLRRDADSPVVLRRDGFRSSKPETDVGGWGGFEGV